MMERIRRKILVVEDEEALARFLSWELESGGFDVHAEYCGESALSWAADHRPDLVILDLRLPDMHGYQVCKELRKLFHPWDVPILMLTAMDKPIDQIRGFAHGADAYLTKPCEPNELFKTISLLLGESAAV
jgi:two-component system alkaline phosphatase synthesis response regulator PhoP